MNRKLVNILLYKVYDVVEKETNDNGYQASHKIFSEDRRNTTYYKVINNDNQGETWNDEYEYTSTLDSKTFKALSLDYNVVFDSTSVLDNIRKLVDYTFMAIFKRNYAMFDKDELIAEVIKDYLNVDFLQSEIDKTMVIANGAYDNYMYEEAAELQYDAEASRNAFHNYVENKDYAETLQAIEDEIQSRNQE